MKLNPSKCAVIAIRHDRRTKNWHVPSNLEVNLEGGRVPVLGPKDVYKYLGVKVGAQGFDVAGHCAEFEARLDRLDKSKLDAKQKLWGLTTVLIPSVYHSLILTNTAVGGLGKLEKLDVKIRRAVRRWHHLPHDVPKAMIHANVGDGGLGVPSLVVRIPRLTQERYQKLLTSDDEVVRFLAGMGLRHQRQQALIRPRHLGDVLVVSCKSERAAWRALLGKTVDGVDCLEREPDTCPVDAWIQDLTVQVKGGEYVKAMAVRSKSLRTPARAARGGRGDPKCKECGQVADLAHISQDCSLTHGRRVARHDAVVDTLARVLTNRRFSVTREPRIGQAGRGPQGSGFLKPDLVCTKGKKAYVLDPIVTRQRRMRDREQEKVTKYSGETVRNFAMRDGIDSMEVRGIAVSYRGYMLPETIKFLKGLGIPRRALAYLMIRVLNETWYLWKAYTDGTAGRTAPVRRRR